MWRESVVREKLPAGVEVEANPPLLPPRKTKIVEQALRLARAVERKFMKLKDKSAWRLYFTLPPDESKGRKYKQNSHVGVVATYLHEAIHKTLEHYPDAKIYTVTHAGEINFIS